MLWHWSISEVEGTLVIDERFSEGLRDIRTGQRIVGIFAFHRSPGFRFEYLRQTSGEHGKETGPPVSLQTVDCVPTVKGRCL